MKRRTLALLMAILMVILSFPAAASARPESNGGNPAGSYTVNVGERFHMEYWGTDYTDYTGQYKSEYTIETGADLAEIYQSTITFKGAGKVTVRSKTYEFINNQFSKVPCRSDFWSFTVVDNGPVIVTQPADATIKIDGKVTFEIEATGQGLTYQWVATNPGTKYKSTYPAQTSSTFKTMPSAYDKQFHCVVTDSKGRKVTSEPANVIIPTGSFIKTQPKDQTYDPNGSASFTCEGTQSCSYEWYLTTEDGYRSWNIPWSDAQKEYGIKASGTTSRTLKLENIPAELDGYVVYCQLADYRISEYAAMNCSVKPIHEIKISAEWNSDRSGLINVKSQTAGVSISGVQYSMFGKLFDKTAPKDNVTVVFVCSLDSGHSFAGDCTAYWNGEKQNAFVKDSDTAGRFGFDVTVPYPDGGLAISEVKVDIEEPKAGEALAETASVPGKTTGGAKQQFIGRNYTVSRVLWWDTAAQKYVTMAEAGHTYQAEITVAADENYQFTAATEAFINDKTAEIVNQASDKMTFRVAFALEAEPAPEPSVPAQPEAPALPQQPAAPVQPEAPTVPQQPAKPEKPAEKDSIKLYIGKTDTYVNGEEVENDVAPLIRNNRTFVPVRIVSEMMGMEVGWNGKTRQVTIENGDDEVILTIGSEEAEANGRIVILDAAPFIMNNRTFVPIRFVSENLGLHVEWDGTERSVLITPEE